MQHMMNSYQQPVGYPLEGWSARPLPGNVTLSGRFCRIEPLNVERHASDLYAAHSLTPDGRDWTYLPIGPFQDQEDYRNYIAQAAQRTDPKSYAIIDLATGKAIGSFALMRIDAANGAIEVGYVAFSALLKRTPMATEAHFLLMGYVFETLQYRRYEWKCDSLNAPSRAAAERLGFCFEGLFRQAVVYKGRTRDTTWFSVIDSEWLSRKHRFMAWLAKENFTSDGKQIRTLRDISAMNTTDKSETHQGQG